MNPSLKAEFAARDGDLRIPLLLGIANWLLFLDHIPNNAVGALTLRNFGFSGAIDLFVFVGGYAAAIAYARIMLDRGVLVGATRIFGRVGQLYAAYIVLFVVYVDLISYVAAQTAAPEIIAEFNVTGFIDHPIQTLLRGLLLQVRPRNLDVLQLFIALALQFPVILFGLLRFPRPTLAISVAVYLAVRIYDWNLASYPEGSWHFNPFAWQLLFVLGAWFALGGMNQSRTIRAIQAAPGFRIATLLYLLFALLVTLAAKVPFLAEIMPDWALNAFLPSDKESLTLYRVLHLLALAFVFTHVVPTDWLGLRRSALGPLLKCGEEWLAIFCSGVFLSFAAHLVLITGPNSVAMQILVSAAGILIMTGIAYYISWSRQQDRRPAVGARPR